MLRPCWQARCACRPGSAIPRTVQELAGSAPVTPLGHDIDSLALLGTQFESALIGTRNEAAEVSARGGYGRAQGPGSGFIVSASRANLRFFPDAALAIARVLPGDPGQDGALIAHDAEGEIQHRIAFSSDYDRRVALALDAEPDPAVCPAPLPPLAGNVVSLGAVRAARERWDRTCASGHLNELLRGRGRQRLHCLAHLGRDRAWKIAHRALPGFLDHLRARQRNFVRMACGDGVMQAQSGPLHRLARQDALLTCDAGDNRFTLDLSRIGQAWVCASRLHWQLEFYDSAQRAVAVLSAPPMACGQDWRGWLLALPRAA